MERAYQLINLLNTATSFTDILYTFGRYYMQQYGCTIDFNIVMGVDLQAIYTMMAECAKKPTPIGILEEIEAVHEKLYVVFYNCYFHKYLKHYVPRWVQTDPLHSQRYSSHQKKGSSL